MLKASSQKPARKTKLGDTAETSSTPKTTSPPRNPVETPAATPVATPADLPQTVSPVRLYRTEPGPTMLHKPIEWKPMTVPAVEPLLKDSDRLQLRRCILEFCDDWRLGLKAAEPLRSSAHIFLTAMEAVRRGTNGRLKEFMRMALRPPGDTDESSNAMRDRILTLLEDVKKLYAPRVTYGEMERVWRAVVQGVRPFDEFLLEFANALGEMSLAGDAQVPKRSPLPNQEVVEQLEVAVTAHWAAFLDVERRTSTSLFEGDKDGWIQLAQRISDADARERHRRLQQAMLANSGTEAPKRQGTRKASRANQPKLPKEVETAGELSSQAGKVSFIQPVSPGGPTPRHDERGPKEKEKRRRGEEEAGSSRSRRAEDGKRSRGVCWECKQSGHFSSSCPHKAALEKLRQQLFQPAVEESDE